MDSPTHSTAKPGMFGDRFSLSKVRVHEIKITHEDRNPKP
jgi:hypothetical protein